MHGGVEGYVAAAAGGGGWGVGLWWRRGRLGHARVGCHFVAVFCGVGEGLVGLLLGGGWREGTVEAHCMWCWGWAGEGLRLALRVVAVVWRLAGHGRWVVV